MASSSLGDLSTSTAQAANQKQYLGQTATRQPLLELAAGIHGATNNAQARGNAILGGGGGIYSPSHDGIPYWRRPGFTPMGSGSGGAGGSGGTGGA